MKKNKITKKITTVLITIFILFYFINCTDPLDDSSDLLNEPSDTLTETIPIAPSELEAHAISTTEIDLLWTDNSDNEAEFQIQRKEASASSWQFIKIMESDITSYSDSELESYTEYNYRIRAVNSAGGSEWSAEISESTLSLAASIPDLAGEYDSGTSSSDNITNRTTGLIFSGTSEIDATVSLYSDIDGYLGEISTSIGLWNISVDLTEGTHSITAATTLHGETLPLSEALSVTIDTTPPEGIPSILKPMQGRNTGVNLRPTFTWTTASEADLYELQASITSSFAPVLELDNQTKNLYIWQNLPGTEFTPDLDMSASDSQPVGTRYYLRMRGIDAAGNHGDWSNSEMLRYVNIGRFDDDFNGDGYSDVIIGANLNDGEGSNAGRAYIFLGGLVMSDTADVTLKDGSTYDFFGETVASAGDVNGDGYADAIVGASYDDPKGNNSGSAYIYYGGSTMDNIADVTMTTQAANDYFGVSTASAGDVNGDGYTDVIVGAEKAVGGEGPGSAYIYYGGQSMNNVADVIMTGESAGDLFGNSVSSTGDINSDGYSDVIVGAIKTYAGNAYIYFGGSSMDNEADVIMEGEEEDDFFGRSVAFAGDVNGDGYSDVIIGADWAGYLWSTGCAYIYYGGESFNNTADIVMTGESSLNHFGISVASSGDVNNDGYDDVIIGADCNDSGGFRSGEAYIYFGSMTMDNVPDLTITGEAEEDFFGTSVSSAGDVNGDGYDDVIVGAEGTDNGTAYIYYGGGAMNRDEDFIMTGEAADDKFGCCVD